MRSYPNINDRASIRDAIKSINVLGEYTRSYSIGDDGEMEPDQYIQELGDFFSDHQIMQAVNCLFDNSFAVNHTDGVIVGISRERITVETKDGEKLIFERDDSAPLPGRFIERK